MDPAGLNPKYDIGIVGAGLAGLAAAHEISRLPGLGPVALIDPLAPGSLTSACSGDNFRNWWPHPVMRALTEDSIRRLQAIADETGNRIGLQMNGYLLATRNPDLEPLLARLRLGYSSENILLLESATDNVAGVAADASVLTHEPSIRRLWPHFDPAVSAVTLIRRAGRLDGHQLAQWLLEQARDRQVTRVREQVTGVDHGADFTLSLAAGGALRCERLVIAAGPFVNDLVGCFEAPLPTCNVLQQKIAVEDAAGAVPRDQAFVIDLDEGPLDFDDESREALASDPELNWLAGSVPGGSHCRPEGSGQWIKLGWAFNRTPESPQVQPSLNPQFPELVLRAAARLNPSLGRYLDHLPDARSHYGGYYTMTAENWPLIGPLNTPGAYVIGALSGFGTMAACAAGALCAAWLGGGPLPDYAAALSLQRYNDEALMKALKASDDRGVI